MSTTHPAPHAHPRRAARAAHAMTCVALLASIAACGEDDTALDGNATSRLAAEAQSILDQHLAAHEFPGAVLALHDPERGDVLVSSGQVRPAPEAAPVDPDVPWGIGSITKTFVAVVALQLAEEGTLDLDASVAPSFPELPRADEITARRLLQHTSGLNEYLDSPAVLADPRRHWSPRELIAAAVALGPMAEPGAGHHYSNTNYIALGEIVSALDGRPWDESIRVRVLEPLGMQHTAYIGQPSAPPIGPGFGLVDGQFVDYTHRHDASLGGAAGGLQSTASDLLRFARALLDGELLDAQSQAAMRAFIPAEPYGNVSHAYGLGLERYTAGDLALDGHLGRSAAHAAFIGFDPASGIATAVLINAEEPAPPALMGLEMVAAASSPPR